MLGFQPGLMKWLTQQTAQRKRSNDRVNPAYTGSESVVNGKLELFRIPPTDVSASSDLMVPIEPVPHPSTFKWMPIMIL